MWKLKEERGLLRYSREINSLEVSDKFYLFLLSRCTQLMEPSVHTFLFIHLSFSLFFFLMFVFVERVVKIISTGVQGLGRGPKGIYRCETRRDRETYSVSATRVNVQSACKFSIGVRFIFDLVSFPTRFSCTASL